MQFALRTPDLELGVGGGNRTRTDDPLRAKQILQFPGNALFSGLFFSVSYGLCVETCGSLWFREALNSYKFDYSRVRLLGFH